MPGKPKATAFSEFRHFAEWQSSGKTRIKREFLPPLAAYLLMLSKRYEKAALAMRNKFVKDSVPGMIEAAKRMDWACEHLKWIADALPVNFDTEDWKASVTEVCKMMHIAIGSEPIADIGDDTFADLIPVPTDASDEDASGANLQRRVVPVPVPEQRTGKPPRKRS